MDDISGGAPGAGPKNKKPRHHLSRSLTYHHHPYQGRHLLPPPPPAPGPQRPQSVVLYTTSLRGVRRTFADCCAVRAALRGLRVAVDERDVSMDAALRRELQGFLAARGRAFSLPQLLVGGALVGGADEVRRLHESGELRRILEGAPGQDPAFVCGACGGFRFAPCPACDGSRKVFVEEEGRARRCIECNENGLNLWRHGCLCWERLPLDHDLGLLALALLQLLPGHAHAHGRRLTSPRWPNPPPPSEIRTSKAAAVEMRGTLEQTAEASSEGKVANHERERTASLLWRAVGLGPPRGASAWPADGSGASSFCELAIRERRATPRWESDCRLSVSGGRNWGHF